MGIRVLFMSIFVIASVFDRIKYVIAIPVIVIMIIINLGTIMPLMITYPIMLRGLSISSYFLSSYFLTRPAFSNFSRSL